MISFGAGSALCDGAAEGMSMMRVSRLADYAVLLLSHMAREGDEAFNALDLARATHVPGPTVSKVLAVLTRGGILASTRGSKGGYRLARPARAISVDAIVAAVDGPVALTVCVEHGPGSCEVEGYCTSRANWRKINDAVREALGSVSLADIAAPAIPDFLPPEARLPETLAENK